VRIREGGVRKVESMIDVGGNGGIEGGVGGGGEGGQEGGNRS